MSVLFSVSYWESTKNNKFLICVTHTHDGSWWNEWKSRSTGSLQTGLMRSEEYSAHTTNFVQQCCNHIKQKMEQRERRRLLLRLTWGSPVMKTRSGRTEAETRCCPSSSGETGGPSGRSTPGPGRDALPPECSDRGSPSSTCRSGGGDATLKRLVLDSALVGLHDRRKRTF